MDLTDKITTATGIGPKTAWLLERLNIYTIEDLLFHIPYKYQDRTNVKKISELIPNENVSVTGIVERIDNIFTPYGKRLTKAVLKDETGTLNLLWFNQHFLTKTIYKGSYLTVFGTLDYKSSKPQMLGPEWEIHRSTPDAEGMIDSIGGGSSGFVPVYPTTAGITSKWIHQKIIQILKIADIVELFPSHILDRYSLINRKSALEIIHSPENLENVELAKRTLAFEEVLFLHLKGIKLKKFWQSKENSHKIEIDRSHLEQFIARLPYELTGDQNKSIKEILIDLKNEAPMNRLLQGDVGSGKTIVAVTAILACAKSKFNSIIMAPTQILAEQHYKTIGHFLEQYGVEVILLTGKEKTKPKTNNPYIVVSTHAILHNLDNFSNVGLVVIDEQHKFGVEQRTKVIEFYTQKGEENKKDIIPNLLTMTATPIPRSLALTLYGDLELSQINQMPVNRKVVTTWVITEDKRQNSYNWMKSQITNLKIQIFIVCPFIEESEVDNLKNVKAAEIEFKKIQKEFKDFRVGLLHGKLAKKDKETVISKFYKHELDILVTTPVIEVGVDIPNANIILIETPERFGLASLHQLRGRVGRGENQGYCILIPGVSDGGALSRLKKMETIHNGNLLSEIDMKIRGPGDIYGTMQHGYINLKVADIRDIELIKTTKVLATELFSKLEEYPSIHEKLDRSTYVEEN